MSTSEQSGNHSDRIILAVSTMKYEKRTVDCLLDLVGANFLYGRVIPECSLLPAARNLSVKTAYEKFPDFSHILFIDDDMDNFNALHVKRLWDADKDIISGLMTVRQPPYKIVSIFEDLNDGEIFEHIKNEDVVEVKQTGCAFTLIKREVFDETGENTPEGESWFDMDRRPRNNFDVEANDYAIDLLKRNVSKDDILGAIAFGVSGHVGSIPIGEDISFCLKAKDAGFKVWVDCGCPVGHLGLTAFDYRHTYTNLEMENEKKRNAKPELSIVTD